MQIYNPMNDPIALWQELYCKALLELDRDKLASYIELAEDAIRARRERLQHVPDDAHATERQALEDALHALNSLRRTSRQGQNKGELSNA